MTDPHRPGRARAVQGAWALTLAELIDTVGDTPVVADLSLGAWRSHEAAHQLCAQLGLAPPVRQTPGPVPGTRYDGSGLPGYADTISVGIDADAAGDQAVLAAHAMIARILPALLSVPQPTVAVLAPRAGRSWQEQDAAFLELLMRAFPRRGGRVLLVATDHVEPALPPGWHVSWRPGPRRASPARPRRPDTGLWGLVPAVIDAELARSLSHTGELRALHSLPGRCWLVPPEHRPAAAATRGDFDRLAAASGGWLRAYAQLHGNNVFADSHLLCTRAWEVFTEGGCDIAIRLLEHAAACARTGQDRRLLQAQLAALRIAASRYADAAAAPDPSPALPPDLRGFLLQAKGWGLAMSSDQADAGAAETYLGQARDALTGVAGERERLYLLNISALARLKTGAAGAALDLERQIEQRARRLARRDYALEYVNAMNQARLYRRLGDLDSAGRYYRRAFVTVEGVRSDSDAVHVHACLARIAEEAGRWQDAYLAWLRAALFWVSAPAPDGLGWRVAAVITGRSPHGADRVEFVAAALAERLHKAARALGAAGLEAADGCEGAAAPRFVRLLQASAPAAWAAGGAGWSVFGGDAPGPARRHGTTLSGGAGGGTAAVGDEILDGPDATALRVLLRRALTPMCPAVDIGGADPILIDDRFGREMPATAAQLTTSCLRAGVGRMYLPGGVVELDGELSSRLLRRLRIRLGPAVDRLQSLPGVTAVTVVSFRRYLPPRLLTAQETRLVAAVDDEPTLAELTLRLGTATIGETSTVLAGLEAARVVCLDLPEQSFAAETGGHHGQRPGPRRLRVGTPRRADSRVEREPLPPGRVVMTTGDRVPVPGSQRGLPPEARQIGRPGPDRQIDVTVVVRRRADPERVRQVVAKAATSFGSPVSRDEFAANLGADPAELDRVARFGRSSGLQVLASDPARRVVVLTGPVSALEEAFGVELGLYQHGEQRYRGRVGPVYVPADLGEIVEAVYGLDDRPQSRPHAVVDSVEPGEAAARLTARDVARLYDFPLDATGDGQRIGLIELGGGYHPADLKVYCDTVGVPVPAIIDVSVGGATNSPSPTPSAADREVALDLQTAAAVAPRATFVVYFAPNTDQGFIDALTTAIHDATHRPSVLSISWGAAEIRWTGQARSGLAQALVDAAMLGITVCCSSGDQGSNGGEGDKRAHVELPASSPYALACGGTTLHTDGATITGEVVWTNGGQSSGGGISEVFDVPAWQLSMSIPPSANPGAHPGRGVPDVAANADWQVAYRICVRGVWDCVGGTSAVAPLWAGLTALLNQRLATSMGWLNPLLYEHAAGAFHDIVSGNNGAYQARSGWDPCTGLGSPHGSRLIGVLADLAAADPMRPRPAN